MKKTRLEILKGKLERLQTSLDKESERLRRMSNNIGWGAGMRRTRCTPSFRREDEIKAKIEHVKNEISELSKEGNNGNS